MSDESTSTATLPYMTMDIASEAMAQISDLDQLSRFLVERLRELSAARLVALIQCADSRDDHIHGLLAIAPPERQALMSEDVFQDIVTEIHDLPSDEPWVSSDARIPEVIRDFLEKKHFRRNLVVPMRVGEDRVGALLLLGLITEGSLPILKQVLKSITGVAALAMKHSMLLHRQEQMIAQRTERLRESEERHRIISNVTSDYVYSLEIKRSGHFEIKWVSGAIEQITGYSVEEINAMEEGWLSIVHPNDLVRFFPELQADIRSGAGCYEYRIRAKDGSLRWLSDNIHPFWDEEQQRITHFLGGVQNITARKNAESALRENEQKYRALIENSPDVFMRFDRQGRHLFVSENVRNVAGIEPEAMIGRDHEELGFPLDLCAFWKEKINKVFHTGEALETEFSFRGPESAYTFNWRLIPECNAHGQLTTVLAIARDITEHRKVEQDYQNLFEQLLDGFALHEMIYDEDGTPIDYRFVSVNPAFEILTGLRAEEIVGRTVMDVMPGTEARWIETYGAVAKSGDPARFERYSRELDKHFEVLAYRPQPDHFACIFQDVTERKKAGEALKQSESRYRRLFEESNDAVFIHLADGKIFDVNQQACKLLDYKRPDLLGLRIPDLHPPEAVELVSQAMVATQERGKARFETEMQCADGEIVNVEISAKLIDPWKGYIQSIVRDVTERKTAELELSQERDFTTAILNSAGALIVVLKRDGSIVRFNRACENTTGFHFEEVCGKKIWDVLVVPEEVRAVKHIWQHRGLSTFPAMIEGRWRTKDGRTRLIAWSNTDLGEAESDTSYVVSIGVDITEQRRAEHQAERHKEQLIRADKLASLGTLVAGMAHEINNPNNFIMMNIGILRELWQAIDAELKTRHQENDVEIAGIPYDELGEQVHDLFAGLEDGAERIRRIVHDLRTYARNETTDMSQRVCLNDVVESALTLLRNTIRKATNTLTVDCDPELPLICGNFQRIEQALINIVSNAAQALIDPTQAIRIRTFQDPDRNQALLEVQDEGVGIAHDIQRDILDPFFTTKRDIGGTGLGLSICAGIIEEHKGSISFESEPDHGTTVTIAFPVPRIPQAKKEPTL